MNSIQLTCRHIFIFLFFPFFGATAQGIDDKIDIKGLETYISTSMDDWEIPGLAIAMVKDGEIVYSKGFGSRDIEKGGVVDEHTLFAVASNSKAFTATALAMLVDQGKLSWKDKVKDYLPWFELYDPYVSNECMIEDLLSHRVGLKTFSGDLLWYHTDYTSREIVERARHLNPVFSFRSGYGYSNLMYIAAGEVLQQITDTSWNDYLQYRILDPLGMKRTNTSVKALEDMKNVASPHVHYQGEQIVVPYLNWDNAAPAAAINSSVSDMGKWLIFQLNYGRVKGIQYINPSLLWYLQTNHTLKTVSQRRKELWPSTHFEGYGLGWSLFDYHGKKIVGHGGGSDGMISRVTIVPEVNFGFVILTNNINYLPSALSYYILDDYFGSPEKDWSSTYMAFKKGREIEYDAYWQNLKKNRVKNTKPTMNLEDFTGTYHSKMYGDVNVGLENENLVVNFGPAKNLTGLLTHWHFNTFVIELNNIKTLPKGTVKFVTNENNEPVEMKIDIPNPDFYFTELKLYKQK